jgi:nucleoside phosphorylase
MIAASSEPAAAAAAEPKPAAVTSVLLVVAMEEEAAPIIAKFGMRKLEHRFLPGAPFVAWEGLVGALTLRLVWCGRDERFGGNNVATTAAAVATYAAISALGEPTPQLVMSVGTAGGFAERGARICDVYLSTKCVYHARRIPEGGAGGELEEQGFGHYRSPALAGLSAAAGLKTGVVSTSDSLDTSEKDMELMLSEGAVVKEMEAAAVGWVCKQLQIPFVALKGVTDLVDGEETTREEFEANLTAAARALEAKLGIVLTLLQQRPLSGWASKS